MVKGRGRTTLTMLVGVVLLTAPAAPGDSLGADSAAATITVGGREYPLHPGSLAERPACASPLVLPDGREVVLIYTLADRFALADVSPPDAAERDRQRRVDAADFPALARSGLHDSSELAAMRTITGRSLAWITELGRPGRLSDDGFFAEDEDVLSVMAADDATVRALGLTHAGLARPLFHVWNLIQLDLALGNWNMGEHRWGNVRALHYRGGAVQVEAHDTNGGQESIFADSLGGSFWIEIRRDLMPEEKAWLRARYGHLEAERLERLEGLLTGIVTGEMEAYYIQWYGFYEGHTPWRTDPVVIARIFGLRSLPEIEAVFPGRLDALLMTHHTRPAGEGEGLR